jgi:hypothetical protein
VNNDLTARILDAWRVAKTTNSHQNDTFDIHTMAAIAADIAKRGRSWTADQPIPDDVPTVWIAPGLSFTRTKSDPAWWVINDEVSEQRLIESFGTVYENEPTWLTLVTESTASTVTPLRTNTTGTDSYGNSSDDSDHLATARTALVNATQTLEAVADRRGYTITVDTAARCASQARACDKAWDALSDLTTHTSATPWVNP